jgi:hypothetical protein
MGLANGFPATQMGVPEVANTGGRVYDAGVELTVSKTEKKIAPKKCTILC